MSKFQRDLDSISKMIATTMNPFAEVLLEGTNRYCLADGKKMPDDVKDDMLRLFVFGEQVERRVPSSMLKGPYKV